MRLHRAVLAGLAFGTVLPVTAASAATGVAAAGSALSSATLATLSVGDLTVAGTNLDGHTVSLATLSALAQTTSSEAPAVSFVPITLDGAKTGAVTVTPATSPKTVGALTMGALPLNVLSATSPSATLTATQSAASKAASLTASLGQAKILNLPLTLNGTVDVGSLTDASHAQAGKTLKITNVALPNLADLLAALGIDLSALPVDTLNGLLTELPIAISDAVATAADNANDAIDTAQTAYDAAVAALATVSPNLADATTALDAALAAADTTAVDSALATLGIATPLDHVDWDTLGTTSSGQAVQTALRGDPAIASAADDYKDAKDATDLVTSTLTTLTDAIGDLADIVDGVLSGAPLVEIGAAEVGTKAAVGSAKSSAVTGYVSGVKVLGQDVLAAVTGNTKLDAAALAGTVATQVNSAIASVTGTLSSVLSSVTGATGLVVPAPSIKLLTKTATTGVDGLFGTADATVTALSVDMGSVVVPDAFALADAADLAGILPVAGGFKTSPLSVKVGQLVESAKFHPASTGGSGNLPATGMPYGLAIVAIVGTGLAMTTQRRLRTVEVTD